MNDPFRYSIATRIRERYLSQVLSPKKGDLLLDVGCGLGSFNRILSRDETEYSGIDVDLNSISYAKENVPGHFVLANAENLPFCSNYFNKILCSEVLEHIRSDQKALQEIYRVSSNNATVVITVPTPEGIFGNKIKRIAHNNIEAKEGEYHYRDGYVVQDLITKLKYTGIEIREIKYTMVFFAELWMGLSKIFYLLKAKKMESQTDLLKVKDSLLFKIHKLVFPIVLLIVRLEDFLLAKLLKGHMLIIKGVVKK